MKTLQTCFSNETHIEEPDTSFSTSSSSFLSPEDTPEHIGGKSCPPPNTLIGPGRGPSVFVGRSPYFLWLYKEVHNLADFALRNKFEVSHITPPVSCVLKYIPFEKSELEHLKTQIESVVGDEYIPSDVAHDLAETSEDEDEDIEVQINIKKQGQYKIPPIQSVIQPIHSEPEKCTGGSCVGGDFSSPTPVDHDYSKTPTSSSREEVEGHITLQEPVVRNVGLFNSDPKISLPPLPTRILEDSQVLAVSFLFSFFINICIITCKL